MKANRIKFAILALFIIMIALSSRYFKLEVEDLKGFLGSFALWQAILIFAVIYVIATLFVPLTKDILKIIGALSFGAFLSTLSIWLAEIVNAVILFYLARYLGRGYVEEKLKGKARSLDKKIASSGFRGILILRMVPLIPYRVLDLLVGLTSFSFVSYFIIVIIGSPLRIFWIQYIIEGVGESMVSFLQAKDIVAIFKSTQQLMAYLAQNQVVFAWSFIYLVLVIIVAARLKTRGRI